MSFNNIYKKAIDSLKFYYTDSFVISKFEEMENEDGSEDVKLIEYDTEEYSCHLSTMREDIRDGKSGIQEYEVTYMLFCDIDVPIQRGDKLKIKKVINNKVVQLITAYAGEPVYNNLSQEVILTKESIA